MKTIPLTQDKVALVDDEDYEELSKYKWCYDGNTARRRGAIMSHEILQTDKIVDHKDRNGLNHQKYNLRKCTKSQNQQNQRKTKSKTSSKYKGVCYQRGSWQVNIYFQGILGQNVHKYLGNFLVEEEAARAYDEAAKRYHGEFAALNFPDK